ncbi:hypothetical protein [Rhizobium mongolense]
MTANEYLAGWLSDLSIATGIATMAAIAYKGIFDPFENKEQLKIATKVVLAAAALTIVFFAAGWSFTDDEPPAASTAATSS